MRFSKSGGVWTPWVESRPADCLGPADFSQRPSYRLGRKDGQGVIIRTEVRAVKLFLLEDESPELPLADLEQTAQPGHQHLLVGIGDSSPVELHRPLLDQPSGLGVRRHHTRQDDDLPSRLAVTRGRQVYYINTFR